MLSGYHNMRIIFEKFLTAKHLKTRSFARVTTYCAAIKRESALRPVLSLPKG